MEPKAWVLHSRVSSKEEARKNITIYAGKSLVIRIDSDSERTWALPEVQSHSVRLF